MSKPFDGIRILDFTQVFAGPFASYQLSLMGADVIKVERPGGEDFRRSVPNDDWVGKSMSPGWMAVNANKRDVSFDLKNPKSIEIIKRLAKNADVVMENFRPGVMDRLGIGYEALSAVNPKLIYCALSGFGQSGPEKNTPAYDGKIQAVSGIMSITGHEEMGPTRAGFAVCDALTGMTGAFAIASAIRQRDQTGKGQMIDVAMLDSTLLMMSNIVTEHVTTGHVPELMGNEPQSRSPTAGLFDAKDRPILIAANSDVQFRAFMSALGLEDLVEDPRFYNHLARLDNKPELRQIVNNALKTKTGEEWEELLESVDVPAGVIRNIEEVMAENGQARARGISQEMALPKHNRQIGVPTVGFKVNGDVVAAAAPPPELGSDTETVLAEIGYSKSEVSELRDAGVI